MLRLVFAVAVLLASTAVAVAVPKDTSTATCDSPGLKSYILRNLGHGKSFQTGQAVSSALTYGPILEAKTISNDGHTISCELLIDVGAPGGTRAVRGRFTTTIGGERGNVTWHWAPGD